MNRFNMFFSMFSNRYLTKYVVGSLLGFVLTLFLVSCAPNVQGISNAPTLTSKVVPFGPMPKSANRKPMDVYLTSSLDLVEGDDILAANMVDTFADTIDKRHVILGTITVQGDSPETSPRELVQLLLQEARAVGVPALLIKLPASLENLYQPSAAVNVGLEKLNSGDRLRYKYTNYRTSRDVTETYPIADVALRSSNGNYEPINSNTMQNALAANFNFAPFALSLNAETNLPQIEAYMIFYVPEK